MAPAPWDAKRQAMIEPTSDSDTRTSFEGKQSGEIARTDFDRAAQSDDGQHHPGPSIQQRDTTSNDQQASDSIKSNHKVAIEKKNIRVGTMIALIMSLRIGRPKTALQLIGRRTMAMTMILVRNERNASL